MCVCVCVCVCVWCVCACACDVCACVCDVCVMCVCARVRACAEVWQKNFSKLTSNCNSIHYIKAIDQYSHTEKHMLNVVENSLSSTKDHLLCNKWGSYCRSVCMHPLLSNYIWCMIYSHRLLAHGVILFLLHKLTLCFIIRESWKNWIMTKVTSVD